MTRRPRCWSPRTGRGVAVRSCHSRRAQTRRSTACPSIEHVVTVRRTENEHHFVQGRDHWYHELMAEASADCPPEEMDAEDLLFLLYTSGTTGKPKGIAHSTGGYLTGVGGDPSHDLRHPR